MAGTFDFSAVALITAVAALLGVAIGVMLGQLRANRDGTALRERNAQLAATLDAERHAAQDKLAALEQAREQLRQSFAVLSSEALRVNNEQFLRLAQENLKQFSLQAQGELTKKEQAIEHLVQPIKEVLEKTQTQIRDIERDRKEAFGSISRHLETIAQTQLLLQGETRNLVQALRRPEVRGRWGELTLKRLVELAGMVEYCDFYEQEHTETGEGALRPDMVIRMPGEREVVVDVKTPLDAYLSAIEAPDDAARDRLLERHCRNVRERVQELSGKAYWSQFPHSPDFVILFIPGENFLSAALDKQPTLLEEALARKVILATPTSLVALLRAIAYGWNQQALTKNAEKIRELGEELFRRLTTFTEHLAKVGRHLGSGVDHYNRAVGSFERQVLSSARRFTEMGITATREIEPLEPIEKGVRELSSKGAED